MGWFGAGNPSTRWRRSRSGRTGDERGAPGHDDDTVVIDLTDGASERIADLSPEEQARRDAEAAALAERFRARRARAEAEAELQRLRARHWSGERLIEEARHVAEWWEHPDADPYAVLGLLPGASLEEASAARRRIAQACHPDRIDAATAAGDEALRHMIAANGAFERLRRALRTV